MPTPAEAEEHLRIIRSLMERATTYRAISAPGALVGGTLGIAASFAFGNWWLLNDHPFPSPHGLGGPAFVGLWLGVLGVTGGVNFVFLWREARRRGTPFFSPGMRMAAQAVLPSYTLAAFFTWVLGRSDDAVYLVPIWLLCHGLGLLATSHFAPRSFFWLGWAFLLAGIGAVESILAGKYPGPEHGILPAFLTAQMWMALTFGLFHLAFAICTWPRKQTAPMPALEP